MKRCPGCGYSLRQTEHLARCLLNGVTLTDAQLGVLAQAYLDAEEANCRLRAKASA